MKEPTLIEKLVYYSKAIYQLKRLAIVLRDTQAIMSKIPIVLTTRNHPNAILIETNDKIVKINEYIKSLLEPIFKGKDFGQDITGQWAFSSFDMEKGYVELQEVLKKDLKGNILELSNHKYVLFLSDYHDSKNNIPSGSLLPFTHVAPLLGNVKNVFKA